MVKTVDQPKWLLEFQAAYKKYHAFSEEIYQHLKTHKAELGLNQSYLKALSTRLLSSKIESFKGIPPEDLKAIQEHCFKALGLKAFEDYKTIEKNTLKHLKKNYHNKLESTFDNFSPKSKDFEEYESQIYFKLLELLKTYNPFHEKQASFWTYAKATLRQYIQSLFNEKIAGVKPKDIKTYKSCLQLDKLLSSEDLADYLGWTIARLDAVREACQFVKELDATDASGHKTQLEGIAAPESTQNGQSIDDLLGDIKPHVSELQLSIIKLVLEDVLIHDVAEKLSLTEERVREELRASIENPVVLKRLKP